MENKSNYQGYQTYNPQQSGISRSLQYWNEFDARQDQINYERDQQAQAKAEKEKQEKRALYDKWFKPLNNYDSGSRSLNELQARYLSNAQEEMIPLIEKMESAELGSEEYIRARMKLQSLQQSAEKLKLVTDFYTSAWDQYKKAKDKGSIYEDPQWESLFQNGFENIQLGIDEKGDPVVGFMDSNKDGQNDVKGIVPFEYVKNGVAIPKFMGRITIDQVASKIAENTGEVSTTTEKGYVKRKLINPNEEQINNLTDRIIYNQEGQLSESGKSLLRNAGLNWENPSKEDIDALSEMIKKDVKGRFDTTNEQTTDYSAINQARRINNDEKKDGPQVNINNRVTPSPETWGTNYKSIDTETTFAMPLNQSVNFKALRDNQGNIVSNANVENYTYTKDGSLLLDVSYTKYKSSKEGGEAEDLKTAIISRNDTPPTLPEINARQVIKASTEDEGDLASALGMTTSELRNSVKKKAEKTAGDSIFE